jgi:hypothetical protein
MRIGRLKARADELSRDAWLERRRFQASVGNALAILRRRVGSHAGLAISFSLGFIAGTPRSGKSRRRGKRPGRAREQLAGTIAGSAAKLLVAMLANSLAVASQSPGGAAAAPGRQHQPSRSWRPSSADATSADAPSAAA